MVSSGVGRGDFVGFRGCRPTSITMDGVRCLGGVREEQWGAERLEGL